MRKSNIFDPALVDRWLLRWPSIGLSVLLLCACAPATQYMGIALQPGAAAPEIQGLAMRAQAGDKQAQLDLGIAFEEGRGVERDLKKARKLYAQAASDSGGHIWVYSPSVGNSTSGRVIPIDTGPRQKGLLDAEKRLRRIQTTLLNSSSH